MIYWNSYFDKLWFSGVLILYEKCWMWKIKLSFHLFRRELILNVDNIGRDETIYDFECYSMRVEYRIEWNIVSLDPKCIQEKSLETWWPELQTQKIKINWDIVLIADLQWYTVRDDVDYFIPAQMLQYLYQSIFWTNLVSSISLNWFI